MDFDLCRNISENGKTKGQLVKTVRRSALAATGKSLPAEHLQYFCLVISGYYWPGEMVNIKSVGAFEDRAHHCISVYGVSRLQIIFGFLNAANGGLPSMAAS